MIAARAAGLAGVGVGELAARAGAPLSPTATATATAATDAKSAPDAQRKHTVYYLMGLFTLWVALETPIDPISDYYLDSVHMLQHVLLAFVAPPLLLLGLSPPFKQRLGLGRLAGSAPNWRFLLMAFGTFVKFGKRVFDALPEFDRLRL